MIGTLLFFEENSSSATPSELSTVQQQLRSYSWYLQAPQIRRAERLNMGRCGGLYRIANLLSRASESSLVQRASASDATFARRGLSSGATGSLHACQAPIAAGTLRKFASKAVQQNSRAATATRWRHVSAGSPIRELLKNVSASNAVWGRHIATQALQPSDT